MRRIWLFSANKIKSSFSKQPTQLIVVLNSSLRHIVVTLVFAFKHAEDSDLLTQCLSNQAWPWPRLFSVHRSAKVFAFCKLLHWARNSHRSFPVDRKSRQMITLPKNRQNFEGWTNNENESQGKWYNCKKTSSKCYRLK